MPSLLARFLDPQVRRHLIADEGEFVVDEVIRHPMAIAGAVAGLVGAIVLFGLMPFAGAGWPLLLVLGLVACAVSLWHIHSVHMDRFVVTNMRVFRVHGVFNQRIATMPLMRILDVGMEQPFLGQLFGYGHFVFESAAQEQGLRDIRYVGRPEERDLTIQRVIQRSGARRSFVPGGL